MTHSETIMLMALVGLEISRTGPRSGPGSWGVVDVILMACCKFALLIGLVWFFVDFFRS